MALAHAVFIAVTCGSAVGVRRAQSQSDDGQTRELEVSAGRFSFAPDTIEVAQGERVRLTIRSLDVEHGFAIAALGIDETIPAGGDPVLVEFVADQAGEFPIHCSVFCGRGHVAMSGTLVVRNPESEFASGTAAGASGQQGDRDFTLTTLPTTQALPRFKSAFRVSHRFSRPLGQDDVGNLFENLFGFDSSALIGLEFRFSPVQGGQIGFYCTSDRTIQLSGQYALLRAGRSLVSIDALVAVDGTNNFRDEYSPTVGAIVSWMAGERVALYGQPLWVGNANIGTLLHATRAGLESTEDNTFILGLGS
jgi:plastocyanin